MSLVGVQRDEMGHPIIHGPCPQWINPIKRQFYATVPLRNFKWPDEFTSDDDSQLHIYNHVINDSRLEGYRPKMKYILAFLKELLRRVDDNGGALIVEIADMWQRILIQNATSSNKQTMEDGEDRDFSYKTYFLEDNIETGKKLTLRESNSFLCKGTTGLVTWEAAMVLSEYLIHHGDLLNGHLVVELGCGLGLVGMSSCLHTRPKKYVFTDTNPAVMAALAKNLEVNCIPFMPAEELNHLSVSLEKCDRKNNRADVDVHVSEKQDELGHPIASLQFLDWISVADKDILEMDADIILAADVVFDPSIVCPLVRVISLFLNRRPSCYGLVACTIRNPDTYKQFLNTLDSHDITVEDIEYDTSTTVFFFEQMFAEVHILKLRARS